MVATVALMFALNAPPPRQSWFGTDKVKHFLMSAMVQSVAYSAARTAGMDRRSSQIAGGGAAAIVGIGKEVHDRRHGGPFNTKDLAWDAAGALSAAALMNGTR